MTVRWEIGLVVAVAFGFVVAQSSIRRALNSPWGPAAERSGQWRIIRWTSGTPTTLLLAVTGYRWLGWWWLASLLGGVGIGNLIVFGAAAGITHEDGREAFRQRWIALETISPFIILALAAAITLPLL